MSVEGRVELEGVVLGDELLGEIARRRRRARGLAELLADPEVRDVLGRERRRVARAVDDDEVAGPGPICTNSEKWVSSESV